MDVNALAAGAATVAENSQTKLVEDFNQFLALLTTQLQFQDPLSPMDSSEFTNQLVSFTQVEQAVATNKNLEDLISRVRSSEMSNAVGFLGTEVTIQTDRAGLRDGVAKWEYGLSTNSEETTLTVKDSSGKILHEVSGNNKAGLSEFIWDAPANTPDGIYQLTISAKTADGSEVQTAIYSKGNVETIETLNGQIHLSVNGILTAMNNIQAVKPIDPA
ncbi:MAG: flagellar hook capping protein [Alphaproteobacteria bacterium]|nr:MAG: flagellar hook capping protein [Alphaproteobacteria bacterium]